MELMRREGGSRMLKREIRKNKKDREQAERMISSLYKVERGKCYFL